MSVSIAQSRTDKQTYRERQARGVCTRCENPLDGKWKTQCMACATVTTKRIAEIRKRRRENGECLKCGTPTDGLHCVVCLQRTATAKQKSHRKRRQKLIDAYGGKCKCCGEDRFEFLQIDHVNNDGADHRKLIGRTGLMDWLARHRYPQEGFQLLCANCNFAKGHYGECPHQHEQAVAVQ